MKHVLVKTSHERHTLDGKDLESRSFLPHDLMHFAFAEVTGSQEGFFSAGENLMREETIVGVLQGGYKQYVLEAGEFDASAFLSQLNKYLATQKYSGVDFSNDVLMRIFSTYRTFSTRWHALRTGESLTIEVS